MRARVGILPHSCMPESEPFRQRLLRCRLGRGCNLTENVLDLIRRLGSPHAVAIPGRSCACSYSARPLHSRPKHSHSRRAHTTNQSLRKTCGSVDFRLPLLSGIVTGWRDGRARQSNWSPEQACRTASHGGHYVRLGAATCAIRPKMGSNLTSISHLTVSPTSCAPADGT